MSVIGIAASLARAAAVAIVWSLTGLPARLSAAAHAKIGIGPTDARDIRADSKLLPEESS